MSRRAVGSSGEHGVADAMIKAQRQEPAVAPRPQRCPAPAEVRRTTTAFPGCRRGPASSQGAGGRRPVRGSDLSCLPSANTRAREASGRARWRECPGGQARRCRRLWWSRTRRPPHGRHQPPCAETIVRSSRRPLRAAKNNDGLCQVARRPDCPGARAPPHRPGRPQRSPHRGAACAHEGRSLTPRPLRGE
jgi:hypothetical protein